MKYSLVQCVNGNFSIVSEHGEDKQAAVVAFHNRCMILWNAPDVITGMVKILDEQLDTVDGKMEYITHAASEPTPTPEPEPVESEEGQESEVEGEE